MQEIFYRYNPWWEQEFDLEEAIARPRILELLHKELGSKKITFLTGLRRVGKTTLMKLVIRDLLKETKIDQKYIFYISLDDYNISRRSIIELIEEYRKIHTINFKEKIYLFLDEITYQTNFEQQLKNLYDSQNVKIFSSSSSASILTGKKPYLTGRNKIIEILPLNFEEYLNFKNIKIKQADRHLLTGYFENYMKIGGLPEYVLGEDPEYLKDLVDDIISKDIAIFHKIKNPAILKDFFLLLMERSGKTISLNKVANMLAVSPDTAKRYFQMFLDTYLVYAVPRCGKTNQQILAPKKIYAADLGIRTFFTGWRDKGSLFENYIYLQIKDKKPCYVYQDKHEIDFLTQDKTLIEVKYNQDIKDKQLELFNRFKADRKLVIKSIEDLKKLQNRR